MADFDLTSLALSMVCPANKLIMDDKGLPGVYVERIAQPLNALLTHGDNSIHPAFLYNGIQKDSLFFGKFQAKAHASRAYSLPGEDPAVYINFDTANNYCKNKGDGHHLMTAAEWGFLALLAKKMGTMPKGDNDCGKDASESLYLAIPAYKDEGAVRTATGTGPLTWSDTGTIDGIFDLNGNVWEWLAGMRLVYGELQVIPYNNAADPTIDLSATSTAWRAIRAAATSYNDIFIQPNGTGTTSGSVKLDWLTNHWNWQSAALTSAEDIPRIARKRPVTRFSRRRGTGTLPRQNAEFFLVEKLRFREERPALDRGIRKGTAVRPVSGCAAVPFSFSVRPCRRSVHPRRTESVTLQVGFRLRGLRKYAGLLPLAVADNLHFHLGSPFRLFRWV